MNEAVPRSARSGSARSGSARSARVLSALLLHSSLLSSLPLGLGGCAFAASGERAERPLARDPCDRPARLEVVAIRTDELVPGVALPPGAFAVQVRASLDVDAHVSLPAPDAGALAARAVPPVRLPAGPARDAPGRRPRNLIADLVETAVVGLVDVALLPVSLPLFVLTEGESPPFLVPFPSAGPGVFDDAVLDDAEWQAEVQRRAAPWIEAAQVRARALEVAETSRRCDAIAGGSCDVTALVLEGTDTLWAHVEPAGCQPGAEEIRLVPPAPAPVASPTALTPPSLAATRAAWRAIDDATPAWGARLAAPQRELSRVFSRAPAERQLNALSDDTLVCRVRARGAGWDPWDGAPDLEVRLSVGYAEVTGRTVRLPDERWRSVFVVPGVSLRPGEKVKLSLVDKDAFEDDWGGAAWTSWEGATPLLLEHRRFTADCRVRARDDEDRERQRAIAAFDRALQRRKEGRPLTRHPRAERPLRTALAAAAVHGGWDEPEVVGALARYEERRARRREETRAALAARDVVDDIVLQGVEVRFARVDCGGLACDAELSLRAPRETTISLAHLAKRLRIVDDEGFSYPLESDWDSPLRLEPERVRHVRMRVRERLLSAALALEVGDGGRVLYLRSSSARPGAGTFAPPVNKR